MTKNNFDVIIIGAGHAGLEAAFCTSKLGFKTALLTINKKSVALTPCNPSIGGPAKGIVTREIDALGGMQALATNYALLQIKMLNTSKGPGVWSLRAQIDKNKYHEYFIKQIQKQKNLSLIETTALELLTKNNQICGVKTSKGILNTKKVIITSGTYMNSTIHIGNNTKTEGPDGLKQSANLSKNLKDLGFEIIRLKTGTPPRIQKDSINYDVLEKELGSKEKLCFSHFNQRYIPLNKQEVCYITYTNQNTHDIILKNIKQSAMYSGNISGIGPRYCPSIEDKIVRFANKPRHQIFIEPESKKLDTIYLQGLSSSLPAKVQEQLVHSIKGLEKAKFIKYAYAIEYDAINPVQLWPSLESKKIKGLYFAGQVNGTSGYEEAAAQGLIAGINASLALKNKKPLILKRSESYIGVMIDDIVTKGINDPYRLLTSRAEHRLFLRNDNALDRLIDYGYKIGLVSKSHYQTYKKEKMIIDKTIKWLKTNSLSINKKLTGDKKRLPHNLYSYLKRPEVRLSDIISPTKLNKLSPEVVQKIEIIVKFDGYIKNQQKHINRINKYEDYDISSIKDFSKIDNLSLEARDKLNKVMPLTLGQAQRISGINLNDIVIIKHYVDNNK